MLCERRQPTKKKTFTANKIWHKHSVQYTFGGNITTAKWLTLEAILKSSSLDLQSIKTLVLFRRFTCIQLNKLKLIQPIKWIGIFFLYRHIFLLHGQWMFDRSDDVPCPPFSIFYYNIVFVIFLPMVWRAQRECVPAERDKNRHRTVRARFSERGETMHELVFVGHWYVLVIVLQGC